MNLGVSVAWSYVVHVAFLHHFKAVSGIIIFSSFLQSLPLIILSAM